MATHLSVDNYLQKIKKILKDNGNPDTAEWQMAYMKHKFDFFGLKAPIWMDIAKTFFKEQGIFDGEDLKTFTRLCFDEPQREMHYVAIEMAQQALPHQTEDFIFFLEELIVTQSWWDSVDGLTKLVAFHFARFPHQIRPTTEGWMVSDNMWLQRVAITFQRYYKKKTDAAMLFDYVLRLAHSTEFFIQKGSGWALREYSKIDSQAVLDFVKNHDLPRLTRREAIRLVDDSLFSH